MYQQELNAAMRLSQAQAETQEAGHTVLADRMQMQSDAEVVRNLTHAKEADRQIYLQRLRLIEQREERQVEHMNRELEHMRQEFVNDKLRSVQQVEMRAESYHNSFKNEAEANAKSAELNMEQLSRAYGGEYAS